MAKFIVRRLFSLFLTIVIVSIAIFLIIEAAPGNVARNVLGAHITSEQEASFLAQMGLDKPLYTRYLYWLIGSDWQAARKIGLPVQQIRTQEGFWEWWAVEKDGALVRWKSSGEDLIAEYRLPDGNKKEVVENQRWEVTDPEEEAQKIRVKRSFWGVDTKDHAVLWEKGTDKEVWALIAGVGWQVTTGGPVEYIPLQKGLLRGDPGLSLQTGRPVSNVLFTRLRNSLILAGIAFIIVMPLALLLGLIAGLNEGKPIDRILTVGGLVFAAMPEFATGIFLILIFASSLKVVPGATVFGEQAPWERPDMLILPVLTLTLIELGYVLRITRASIVEVMHSPYIRTAWLKGLPYWRIVSKHALRNALMAPITVIVLHVNWLLGGIVIVEAIFGYPGLGKYLLDSALFKDTNAIEAGAMILVMVAVSTQLIADIIYTFLNPRIRYA